MTLPGMLSEADCWSISGVRSAEKFFTWVPFLAPDATHVFLEGAPDLEIMSLLTDHAESMEYGAPAGTLWSWPRNRRFSLRASPALFSELTRAAAHLAEPQVCAHVHLYRNDEPLVQWFDAFDQPLLVSKVIPRDRVEMFCRTAGGTLSDTVG